ETGRRSIDETKDGFVVEFLYINTRREHWEVDSNEDFKKRVHGDLKFTFKYEAQGQYTCVGVESKLQWICTAPHRSTEYNDTGVEALGATAAQLRTSFTTKKPDVVMPNQVSTPAFHKAKTILGTTDFKNVRLALVEELNGGLRLKIHAERMDGKG